MVYMNRHTGFFYWILTFYFKKTNKHKFNTNGVYINCMCVTYLFGAVVCNLSTWCNGVYVFIYLA